MPVRLADAPDRPSGGRDPRRDVDEQRPLDARVLLGEHAVERLGLARVRGKPSRIAPALRVASGRAGRGAAGW
jgi:hypothetical protein